MSRSSLLVLLGLLTMLVPFSGLPSSWSRILIIIFGTLVAVVGLYERTQHVRSMKRASEQSEPEAAPVAYEPEATPEPTPEPETPQPPQGVSPI